MAYLCPVQRKSKTFTLRQPGKWISKALHWARGFEHHAYFAPNGHEYRHGPFLHLLGAGTIETLQHDTSAFAHLDHYLSHTDDWLMGYMSYDLKNETEKLQSDNPDHLQAPLLYFFRPEHILRFEATEVHIESTREPDLIYEEITHTSFDESRLRPTLPALHQRVSHKAYLQTIDRLREHIEEGDCYEINYCMEFYADAYRADIPQLHQKLNALSPMPFSTSMKLSDWHILSASPERFLKKAGDLLISQPIKGTRKRGQTLAQDEALKQELRNSEKERAENMMIVDLVRNDLARTCVPGTVTVEELFGIYTFRQVHQMISTITGRLAKDKTAVEAIKAAFPMGSMTGAPKVKVMQLTEHYEQSRRGIFSGAAGYFMPGGDFDFNVIIRTLLYNARTQALSFHVGGAITWDSNPQEEYEEALLKAKALMETLGL